MRTPRSGDHALDRYTEAFEARTDESAFEVTVQKSVVIIKGRTLNRRVIAQRVHVPAKELLEIEKTLVQRDQIEVMTHQPDRQAVDVLEVDRMTPGSVSSTTNVTISSYVASVVRSFFLESRGSTKATKATQRAEKTRAALRPSIVLESQQTAAPTAPKRADALIENQRLRRAIEDYNSLFFR